MDFVNKGKEFLSSAKGKELTEDAKDGYATYSKTDGSFQDKAKAVYEGYQKDQKEDSKKEEKK